MIFSLFPKKGIAAVQLNIVVKYWWIKASFFGWHPVCSEKKYIATGQSKILWNTYVKIPAFEKLNDPTSNAGKIWYLFDGEIWRTFKRSGELFSSEKKELWTHVKCRLGPAIQTFD